MTTEPEVTEVVVDDLGLGLALCCDVRCHCQAVVDEPTTTEQEARLHWWCATDQRRGEG